MARSSWLWANASVVALTTVTTAASAGHVQLRVDATLCMRCASASRVTAPAGAGVETARSEGCTPGLYPVVAPTCLGGRVYLVTLSDAEFRVEAAAGPLPRQLLESFL